ncbi:hypothetical protein [Eikenella corrodens]|uniref:hypothetical protein n=1 Tax=Eikenella corrodens TaxID=539 RepID=UPI00129BA6FE|nr:hypothetical protein [Eikenella corrodens]
MGVLPGNCPPRGTERGGPTRRWPQAPPPRRGDRPPAPPHPDQIFVTYQAATSPPYPELKGANLHVYAPPDNPTPAIEAEVKTGETP